MLKTTGLFFKKNRAIVIVLCLAMLARTAYFFIVLRNFGSEGFYLNANGDAREYLKMALQWMQHGTYQNVAGLNEPESFRMPGYPLFISFFYKIIPDAALAILAQNLIFVAFIALFYKFSLKLFKNEKVALISSGLLSLEPSIIYWNSQLITESLFAVLVFLSVYTAFAFYQTKFLCYPALTGLFLSFAIFVRPAGEYLSLIFIIFYIIVSKGIGFKKFVLAVLIFIIAFFLPLSPILARNKDYFGYFAVSDASIVGFGKYLNAISGQGEKITAEEARNPFRHAEIVRKMTIKIIAERPAAFLKIYGLSLAPFFLGDAYVSTFGRIYPNLEKQRVVTDWTGGSSEFFNFIKGRRGMEAVIFFGGKIIWSLLALSAAAGLFYWIFRYKNMRPVLVLLLLLILYFSLASGIGSYSRFRFPVNPYIFLFSALGFNWILSDKMRGGHD